MEVEGFDKVATEEFVDVSVVVSGEWMGIRMRDLPSHACLFSDCFEIRLLLAAEP